MGGSRAAAGLRARALRRSLLRRRIRSSSPATGHARSLLDPLDEREQSVPLQWKRELGHHQTLDSERKRTIRRRFGPGAIEKRRAADRERKSQRGGIGNRERSLHHGDERHVASCTTVCIGHAMKNARLMARGGERLRDTFEQSVFGPNQKNDRHAFTEFGRSQHTQDHALQ